MKAPPSTILLPDAPALVVGPGEAVFVDAEGVIETLAPAKARARARAEKPILCHAPQVARRLGTGSLPAHDLLELFAFVRPARSAPPSGRGLARILGLPEPADRTEEAALLFVIARTLLEELTQLDPRAQAVAKGVALALAAAGWSWGEGVLAALGHAGALPHRAQAQQGLKVWERLPEWSEHAPLAPPGSIPVAASDARLRLAALLGADAEDRPQQGDYASAACEAFQPRPAPDCPRLVLAEAGTGVGKTLGYIAPASLWAEANEGAVWISTFTRNLQRQIDGELDRLYPDPTEKARRVVVRKGRENYLCLLNLEEAVQGLATRPDEALAVGLVARWALASRDGDLMGGDLPGWLPDLVGRGRVQALADRRGECIFSACTHVNKCFIERSIRRARRARLVIANHALVMAQAALGGLDDDTVPARLVFDEGHHLFDAADGAFSAHLAAGEMVELRRWLLGAEEGSRSRARGLKRRAEGLYEADPQATEALESALRAARNLVAPGWTARLSGGTPQGVGERYLAPVRDQVRARSARHDYSLETEVRPPEPGLIEAAAALEIALARLEEGLKALRGRFQAKLDAEADDLDSALRNRLDGLARGIERRGLVPVAAWRRMLTDLAGAADPLFVDWFFIERQDGREIDVGHARAWVDPTLPFARAVLAPAHGALITSATLRDGTGDAEADWRAAEARTGTVHLPLPAVRAAMPSPYDYPNRTRVFIVTDVRKDDLDQVAAAYRELFKAAGGGALGLFTAIVRLREVQKRIVQPLDEAGLPLLAQHVDGLDNATLVDLFRAEEHSCLLGTDALRDGVDVPGRALRLLVFDRVPWPRPDILHKARRPAFGGKAHDDRIARLRLKQAFGRLIRTAADHGVFVLLDPMMPSRLFGAFPEGVLPRRVGLADAVKETRAFLNS
ncbi:MAG: ATP-dependent DNA helicase [Rhodospirillales bacterium]|nr:ATP-dependent DNA helicase [Rhodospirillales bacterium]